MNRNFRWGSQEDFPREETPKWRCEQRGCFEEREMSEAAKARAEVGQPEASKNRGAWG